MRTRQGETICLGEWIRLASADFPPAGGVWGGMRAGFGLGVLIFVSAKFRTSKTGTPPKITSLYSNAQNVSWLLRTKLLFHYNLV